MSSRARVLVSLPFALSLITLLSACGGRLVLRESAPFDLALREGTTWVYGLLIGEAEGAFLTPGVTLEVTAAAALEPPPHPLRLDAVVRFHGGGRYDRFRWPDWRGAGYLVTAVPHDSLRGGTDLYAEVTGPVFRIESLGGDIPGHLPWYVANSTAGLLDLTSWTGVSPVELTPVYLQRGRSADLVVPAPGSRIAGWFSSGGFGWTVTAGDTLLMVPAGNWRCIELTFWSREEGDENGVRHREYWTPGVGLVAWNDEREGGEGRWVLVEYRP